MSKLEENQLNLIKIIENVNNMEGLFETVKAEMEQVGDISRAMRNLKEVEREVS